MRRWLAVAALLVVAGACGSIVPPTPSSTATPTPAPSVPPTASPEPSPLRWTAIQLPMPDDGSPYVLGIVAFKGGYIVVGAILEGCNCDSPPLDRSVTWSSPDGRTWTLNDGIEAFDRASLRGIVTDGSRLVASGYVMPRAGADDRIQAAWRSDDGVTWARAANPAPSVVVAAASGFVGAIPVNRYSSPDVSASSVQFVASADGLAWHATTKPFDADLGDRTEGLSPFGDQVLAVSPTGGVTAIGLQRVDPSSPDAAVAWHSADGSTWSPPVVVEEDAHPAAIAAVDDGVLVALASSFTDASHGAIVRLAGGATTTVLRARDGTWIRRLFSVDGLVIATGFDELDGGSLAWVSTDGGRSFHPTAAPSPFTAERTTIVTSLLRTPGGLIATGEDGGPVVWIAE